jgi:hypothetical protein
MSGNPVTVVRVYVTEGEHQLRRLMTLLHDELRVRGVTVYRGIAGFGPSGVVHAASLVDISLDLPLVVEFFDAPATADAAVARIAPLVKPGHVLTWSAQAHSRSN